MYVLLYVIVRHERLLEPYDLKTTVLLCTKILVPIDVSDGKNLKEDYTYHASQESLVLKGQTTAAAITQKEAFQSGVWIVHIAKYSLDYTLCL